MPKVYQKKSLTINNENDIYRLLTNYQSVPKLENKDEKILFDRCRSGFRKQLAQNINRNLDDVEKLEHNIRDLEEIKTDDDLDQFIESGMDTLTVELKNKIIKNTVNNNNKCKELLQRHTETKSKSKRKVRK